MAITREKKQEVLERVSSVLKDAGSVAFLNFHGLSVGEVDELRSKMKAEGIGYLVAKKTLVKRALADAGVSGEIPELDGELALAWGDDAVAPAREAYTFGKEHDGKLSILGGIFGDRFMNQVEMTEVATIPPLTTLYGMFVNVINSPIQGLAVALSEIAQKKA